MPEGGLDDQLTVPGRGNWSGHEAHRPQPAAMASTRRIAGQETAKLPRTPGRPDGALEQMRYVFHELHADGHHALCQVCGN
jgi:hypothetical protein